MRTVTVRQALEALNALTSNPQRLFESDMTEELEKQSSIVAQFIAESAVRTADKENSGLPCPYCDQKLKTLVVEEKDERFNVQISTNTDKKGLKNLVELLRAFIKDR